MTSRIPFDDQKLEMEEIEGLVSSPPKQQPHQQAASTSSASGNRYACLMMVLGMFLGILFTSDTESLRFWEGKGGEYVDDVEEKKVIEPTTLSPSVKPVADPTPPPTDAAVVPDPTPPPSAAAVPDPTPPPTDAAAVPDPTPPPTDAAPPPSNPPAPDPTPEPVPDTTPPTDALKPTNPPDNDANAKAAKTSNEDIDNPDIDWGATHYPKPSQVVQPDPPLTPEQAQELEKKWGKWAFVDKNKDQRPKDDYCAAYPQRDIPRDKFPDHAWQTDPEYLKDWLEESLKLVDRSVNAILAEYGKEHDGPVSDEIIDEVFEFLTFPAGQKPRGRGSIDRAFWWGGDQSYKGLVRRVLHSLMTNDDFTFVMGGHSAAAGHGNQFKQSYTMQFHKVMEPVMSLLGVPLTSRNLAQGGLGTLQSAIATMDIYGPSIDMLMWDSGMTEGKDGAAIDLFWRQGLLSGDRVPFLIGAAGTESELLYFSQNVDADFGVVGSALAKLPECKDEVQCEALPYAVQFMKCAAEFYQTCNLQKFHSNCWVDRPDVTPEVDQAEHPGSQVKWHPGFRVHQITGRVLALLLLKALRQALSQWQAADNYVLPDDAWHLTAYYDNIRQKLSTKVGETACFKSPHFSPRICNTPMHGRTEFTPRANPEKTSIQSLVKPDENGHVPHVSHGMLYSGPDVHNPFTAIPEGDIDVLSIVSLGRTFDNNNRRLDGITPGLGWTMGADAPPGYCDGSYNAECGRRGNCLLIGHHDHRGGLVFESYSGWLVMTIPAVKEGIIMTKIESWHSASESAVTKDWKSIDNKGRRRQLRGGGRQDNNYYTAVVPYSISYYDYLVEEEERRSLKAMPPAFCDNFQYEFAIDGNITVWTKSDWEAKSTNPQRVVELQTLLDDPNFTKEPKDVELAIRVTGCGDSTRKTFSLTHLYWA